MSDSPGATPPGDKKSGTSLDPPVQYRLYKRRFYGLLGFVLLGIVTGMPWVWFGPISTQTAADFGISVTQVNWLCNIVCCIFIPVSLLIPTVCSRFGITRCAQVGALLTVISAWVRYAGTPASLSSRSAYALLTLGQISSAIAQPVFQVLGPMYSEKWFDLKGRTTATMIIAIANPVGSAIGQVLAPLVGSPRQSILVLAIISTAITPSVFFITDAPPTPPTYAGSKPTQTLVPLCRAILGWSVPPDAYMAPHERLDFIIIASLFGVFVGATTTFSVLSAEWLEPMGYSDTTAGLMGAVLLLAGIVACVITAPLLDRFFTHRLGIVLKVLVPVVSACWLSLIWAIRPNNAAAGFAIFIIIGVCSMTMLPVGLELGVELTRNADASAALLWCNGNLFSIILILAEGALRAPSTANPPYNMTHALILHAVFVVSFGSLIFFIRARQVRREMDETMAAGHHSMGVVLDANIAGALEIPVEAPESILLVDMEKRPDSTGRPVQEVPHDA